MVYESQNHNLKLACGIKFYEGYNVALALDDLLQMNDPSYNISEHFSCSAVNTVYAEMEEGIEDHVMCRTIQLQIYMNTFFISTLQEEFELIAVLYH